jgi:hypothetical protein
MWPDSIKAILRVMALEAFKSFFIEIAPIDAVIHRHGVGQDRANGDGRDVAVLRVAEKHVYVCVGSNVSDWCLPNDLTASTYPELTELGGDRVEIGERAEGRLA